MKSKENILGIVNLQSNVLISIFLIMIAASVAVSFLRFYIWRDYAIESQIDCDPTVETCFVYHCDPGVEECTGDPVADTSYYKLLRRNAQNIPACDPADETCPVLVCEANEPDCIVLHCNETTTEDEAECITPERYNTEHPLEESMEAFGGVDS